MEKLGPAGTVLDAEYQRKTLRSLKSLFVTVQGEKAAPGHKKHYLLPLKEKRRLFGHYKEKKAPRLP
ncbi:hypothetical protein BAVI_14544 [Neobacillus vireti LMG 21834]|uniref:Uncharacterized protein n=1 Tax=Neobacillus vireti LMG 21834 TaxID=1131730 RepID=A0AB94ILW4_9BACI|nr:hypothetical protein BAVI_14544 [Neobacillus vireti LMG 21834]KLT18379.1 hypothetical protein AA980_08650 [Neobacillus vireti]